MTEPWNGRGRKLTPVVRFRYMCDILIDRLTRGRYEELDRMHELALNYLEQAKKKKYSRTIIRKCETALATCILLKNTNNGE